MVSKRIIHIYSDPKFVTEVRKFESEYFDNVLIFLGNREEIPKSLQAKNITFYSKKRDVIPKILKISTGADLVVINGLDYFNERIVLNLPERVKIAWRFYGSELYSRMPDAVFSGLTQDALNVNVIRRFVITSVKRNLIKVLPSLSSFNRAIRRIDYFLGAFREEYDLLRSVGFDLPPFIMLPFKFQYFTKGLVFPKKPLIILGNSRSPFNNHLNILEEMKGIPLPPDLRIILFFNYCKESNYTRVVRKEAEKWPQIELVERFLQKSEFRKVYQQSAALVINGYRQMALGNIFTAICSGTKIYLSERNITYKWMKSLQFEISTIEMDLSHDLGKSNFYSTEEHAEHNLRKLIELTDRYTYKDFQKVILQS